MEHCPYLARCRFVPRHAEACLYQYSVSFSVSSVLERARLAPHTCPFVASLQGVYFNQKEFLLSLLNGTWHSAVIYYFARFSLGGGTVFPNGWTGGWELMSQAMAWTVLV